MASPHPTTCRSSVCLSIDLSIHACMHPSMHPSIHPTIFLSARVSMHPCIHPSVQSYMHSFTCACMQSKPSASFINYICELLRHTRGISSIFQKSHSISNLVNKQPLHVLYTRVNVHKRMCPQNSRLPLSPLPACVSCLSVKSCRQCNKADSANGKDLMVTLGTLHVNLA